MHDRNSQPHAHGVEQLQTEDHTLPSLSGIMPHKLCGNKLNNCDSDRAQQTRKKLLQTPP